MSRQCRPKLHIEERALERHERVIASEHPRVEAERRERPEQSQPLALPAEGPRTAARPHKGLGGRALGGAMGGGGGGKAWGEGWRGWEGGGALG